MKESNTKGLTIVFEHHGQKIPIRIHFSKRSQRLILKIDKKAHGGILTLPPHKPISLGRKFIKDNIDWLGNALDALPPKKFVTEGQSLILADERVTIRHDPSLKLGVQLIGKELVVSGDKAHLPRRVSDWLKKYARGIISQKAYKMADSLKKDISRITLRDTSSRWGSCSHLGNLSFCWRLILTPNFVIDYVIAHEVSHLVHMNHSNQFWSTVDSLIPNRTSAQQWLKNHGDSIQRIYF